MAELLARLESAVGAAYRIDRELGGGGMSRVFLAEEIDLGRQVVIKVLPPDMAAGVNQERFRREIQLAAKLQHPHIVPVLSAGTAAADLLYYVMPYIEGESLRTKLAREGELPVGEVVRILRDVVDALAYAHSREVVHRDIKPDNIMLSGKHALVTDFGVAKAVTASSGGSSSLTSLGVALGTPAYMAPEQAAADPPTDHRADIYALGALTYEMLSGRPPFTASTPQGVLAAHVSEIPEPVTKHRPSVHPELAALVMRCLEKKAADRWQKADELLPHLEAITTPSGGVTPTGTQPVSVVDYDVAARMSHPLRVAGLFGLAAVGALAIVYFVIQFLGLPDWVFYAAMALLAVGFPIMLLTGHHERERALARTTGTAIPRATGTASGLPTPHGLRRLFTWKTSLLGGGVAFAGLGVVTVAYMAMRLLGIGPVGTLVASGVLEERDRLILAEFENRTTDSILGESVTEAFRVDLAQSPIIKLVDASSIAGALERMNRDLGTRMDVSLAREIAEREGIKAVVTGEIGAVGSGFVLSANLLSAADGEVLVAVRENARDDGAIIDAIDRLSAKLRERIGESLRTIRGNEPLEQVTTASLEALRKYSQALQAEEREGEFERAIQLLEEAIALDTAFAMAYRKLAVVLGNSFGEQSQVMEAATKAFQHRDRLPGLERYLATAYYYSTVDYERDAVVRAYRSVLEIDPDEMTALNNLAIELGNMRQYAEAEALTRRAMAVGDAWQFYQGTAAAQVAQGKLEEARSTVAVFAERFPDSPQLLRMRGFLAVARGDHDSAQADFEALAESRQDSFWRRQGAFFLYALATTHGKLAEAARYLDEFTARAEERGLPSNAIVGAAQLGLTHVLYRESPEDGLRVVEAALQRHPLDGMAAVDRPYPALIDFYAHAGRPGQARRLLAEYEAEVPDGVRRSDPFRHGARAALALAEERYDEAIAGYREWYEESGCATCAQFELGRTYDLAGQTDSATAAYERAVSAPGMGRWANQFQWLGQTYKRLGELYEERGDRERSVEYYDRFVSLWAEADSELRPVVSDVRGRIARLVGER